MSTLLFPGHETLLEKVKKIFADLVQYNFELSYFKSLSNLHGHSCIYRILYNCGYNFFSISSIPYPHIPSFSFFFLRKPRFIQWDSFIFLPTSKISLQFLLLPSHYQERQTPPFMLKSLLYTWNPIPSCLFQNHVPFVPFLCGIFSLTTGSFSSVYKSLRSPRFCFLP